MRGQRISAIGRDERVEPVLHLRRVGAVPGFGDCGLEDGVQIVLEFAADVVVRRLDVAALQANVDEGVEPLGREREHRTAHCAQDWVPGPRGVRHRACGSIDLRQSPVEPTSICSRQGRGHVCGRTDGQRRERHRVLPGVENESELGGDQGVELTQCGLAGHAERGREFENCLDAVLRRGVADK